ncbi:MAG TPA: MFS transporter [Victivallales bacterium]|nr:MFS transporter [Victivallales bacterium]
MNKTGSVRSLKWLNFFSADIPDGLAPFLAIYLMTSLHWSSKDIGIILTASGIAGLILQTPAGAFIDWCKFKRLIIALPVGIIALSTLMIIYSEGLFSEILCLKILIGISAVFIGPAIASITLGLCGPKEFPHLAGKTSAYNHAGNVVAALLAGLIGQLYGIKIVFTLVIATSLISIFFLFKIKSSDIDYRLARGFTEEHKEEHKASIIELFSKCPLLFILSISLLLFHLANGAMLPLVGEKLATNNENLSSIFMSACIIAAQISMIPMALLVSKKADSWGRKPLFLIAFIILPIRGVLFTLSVNPILLITVQILDGIANGIFGVVMLIVIADLTKSSGRYNMSLGIVGTIMGIGASCSNTVGGWIASSFSFDTAFLVLAVIAFIGLLVFSIFIPETKNYVTRFE